MEAPADIAMIEEWFRLLADGDYDGMHGLLSMAIENCALLAIENCALLAIENCALSTWCRTPRFGVEVVGLGGAMGNRVGAATIKSLARQPGYP